jgi:hypothetical protein
VGDGYMLPWAFAGVKMKIRDYVDADNKIQAEVKRIMDLGSIPISLYISTRMNEILLSRVYLFLGEGYQRMSSNTFKLAGKNRFMPLLVAYDTVGGYLPVEIWDGEDFYVKHTPEVEEDNFFIGEEDDNSA